MRVSPQGVLSMKDRIDDLKVRTKSGDTNQLIEDGVNLEKLIAKNTSVDLNTINNGKIKSVVEGLRSAEV